MQDDGQPGATIASIFIGSLDIIMGSSIIGPAGVDMGMGSGIVIVMVAILSDSESPHHQRQTSETK